MEAPDFVQDKLTEWGFSEFLQRFEDEGINKETFLSLGDFSDIDGLIPKVGPRIKFKKRLREYLQSDSSETCDFVRNKLTEWGLCDLIQRFEDEGIDKETFLSLEESGNFNDLIPKAGQRIKFRKRHQEYLQALRRRHADTPEVMDTESDTVSDQEDNVEVDPTFFPLCFEPTSASADHENERSDQPSSKSTSHPGLLAMILFLLRHHLTAAMGELVALLNYLSPNLVAACNCLSDKVCVLSTVYCCHVCKNYTTTSHPQGASCSHCKITFNKNNRTTRGHFLSASLKNLLKDILQIHGTELPKTVNHGNDIKDVMDGKMYQNLLKQGALAADDLTLLWNSDGVPLFNSTQYSIWPLQFTVNELPHSLRKENVIVAGLWLGHEKPMMNLFLQPFIDECRDLAKNPFQWRDSNGTIHSSKVFSLVCSSDAEARPLLRNCKKFNGEYGCDWCLHPGMMVKKHKGSMRSYPYDEEKQTARTKEMFRDNAEHAENSSTPKNGVKGFSVLSTLPFFDIVFGFVPEYLHTVLLGVSKQLMCLWLSLSSSGKPWYIGHHISEMDTRLLCLKPPVQTMRSPRPLKAWEQWKASEWQAFLLFYSVSVLPGILPLLFLEHYFCLSFSIHILLQDSISQLDLQVATESLVHFVKGMKELYGEENVSFNCHQLIHLTESVKNWGPLWATSAFVFERNNGYLRTLLTDRNVNPKQIYERFFFWQCIPKHLSSSVFNRNSDFGELLAKISPMKDVSGLKKPLGRSRSLDLTGSLKQAIEKLLRRPVPVRPVEAYDSFTSGHTFYRSVNQKDSDKTDCIVELKNGACGEIQEILVFKENCICASNCLCQAIPIIVARLYDVKPGTLFSRTNPHNTTKHIFVKVERTDQSEAFFIEDIRCKCVQVDGWLLPIPNTCEILESL